jgi:hypothetical protein
VVEDAVSLLFSEAHFPQIHGASPQTGKALGDLIRDSRVNEIMHRAANRGSVGSVAILMQVLKRKVFFKVLPTPYLTPVFDPYNPDRLLSVTRRYKVDPKSLIDAGYQIDEADGQHWVQTVWTDQDEEWYLPYPVQARDPKKPIRPVLDQIRTVTHGLGFCPVVWIRNTPTDADDCDGECTFEAAIDIVGELDALTSQNGRGLKYSADPTLWIKEPSFDPNSGSPIQIGGAAGAIMASDSNSDAKLLETSGEGSRALISQCDRLRAQALEMMHGNRADANKMSAAQSGRAMEMMNQGLVWLADRMRITYGEGGLLDLMRMVCEASAVIQDGILIDSQPYVAIDPTGLMLKWPSWYAVTSTDLFETSNAIQTLTGAGAMSRETAVKLLASMVGVEDVQQELNTIAADQRAQIALLPPTVVSASENP